MFRFAAPYAFLLLGLIPLVVGYRRRHRGPALTASDVPAAFRLPVSPVLVLQRLLPGIYYLVLVLLIAALARPQWGVQRMPTDTYGVNIILALDLSESMEALDFNHDGKIINRLAAVKWVVADFISRRTDDRIGVVVFGSQAYTQLPLTRDYATIAAIVDRLQIGAAGRTTAIGDAIGISLKRLADVESRSNIIILLTDGQSNSGEIAPELAAQIAQQMGVKIHTIGVGGRGPAPYLINDPIFGRRYVYVQDDLDEDTLKSIARTTGGYYFRAQDMESLQKIYDAIDAMEKTNFQVQGFAEYKELYLVLLIPAFALLGLWIVLKNTRFIRVP
jgi:Ca-activated chloride channel homolog